MNLEANTSPNFHPEFAGTFDQCLPYLTYLEIALTRIRKKKRSFFAQKVPVIVVGGAV